MVEAKLSYRLEYRGTHWAVGGQTAAFGRRNRAFLPAPPDMGSIGPALPGLCFSGPVADRA
ncbi:MAG: hypothetical protein KIS68_14710 [Bauldia sp.]|nr:hypothetical protein [Bauldia sp.]